MITSKDIIKLSQVFATKEDLKDLRDEFTLNLASKADINNILNSIDAMSTKLETGYIESLSLSEKVNRHEKWINQAAKK